VHHETTMEAAYFTVDLTVDFAVVLAMDEAAPPPQTSVVGNCCLCDRRIVSGVHGLENGSADGLGDECCDSKFHA
jgi:hypothetical protein